VLEDNRRLDFMKNTGPLLHKNYFSFLSKRLSQIQFTDNTKKYMDVPVELSIDGSDDQCDIFNKVFE
jgi:hypothetical protein